MGDIVTQKNIAALGDLKRLADHSTAVAAGAGNATTVTGLTIDRQGFSTGALPRSAQFGVLYEATLASGNTLSFGYAVQHSANNSDWTDYQTAGSTVVSTATGGAAAPKASFNVAVDLANAKRYVRFNYAPNLSAAGTDTCYADAVGFFGGFDKLPAPTA